MYYSTLIAEDFSSIRDNYEGIVTVHTAQKIVVIKGNTVNDTISNESDVIVFYDVIGDSKPLIILERIPASSISWRKIKRSAKVLSKSLNEYTVTIQKNMNGYYDVVLVRTSIVDTVS